jgi:hypothetical protein
MKLAKSLLLGSAAGLMAVAGANAADLPVRAAAPAVDYVRVCNAYGTGFFFIPGTETCLRVSGMVRWEGRFNQTTNRGQDQFQQFARGEVNFDSRTATEFGLLRTFIRVRSDSLGGATTATFAPQAYIQFGGLTAGRSPNFFTFAASPGFRGEFGARGGTEVDQIAYTATFGAVSATLALQHRVAATIRDPIGGGNVRAGARLPDLVGAIDYSAGGYRVKLAAALTELRTDRAVGLVNPSDKYGWAVLAGVSGPIGATTAFTLQGTYTDGALWFANLGQPSRQFTVDTRDAFVVGNTIRTTTAWSVLGTIAQRWTPQLTQNVYATYGSATPPAAVRGLAFPRAEGWQVGTNIAYVMVPGLTFGADVNYTEIRRRRADIGPVARVKDDRWTATLRIQRDF